MILYLHEYYNWYISYYTRRNSACKNVLRDFQSQPCMIKNLVLKYPSAKNNNKIWMTYINQLFDGIGQKPAHAGLSEALRAGKLIWWALHSCHGFFSKGIFQIARQGIELRQEGIV